MPAVNTLPPPVAPGPLVQHDGPLMQLSGKGLLAPGSWKRRFAVLDQRRLYFYQLKEDNQGYREKTSHYVDLQDYDICEEAKSVKTASNVLVISSSEIEKSFFDTGRLYLSAETATEMNEWISQIRTAMTTLRDGRKPTRSSKSLPADSATNNENKVAVTTSEHPGLVSAISLVSSSEHLDCITKQRAKGPTGRRLPRQAKSRLVFPLTDAVHHQQQQQQRSESLPRLEQTDAVNNIRRKSNKLSTGGHQNHNRSFDAGHPSKRTTVYAYSSSDESLNLSFAAQPTSQQDDETVETLCELPLSSIHHSTSTPSLAVGGHHWLTVGSSSSTPRPLSGKRRSGQQPYSVVAVGSTSTDDPPGLQHQYQLLLQETAAIKTTLSGLEADFGASRRDMGWLQENLTTVQSAASGVSDKVIKMQSQVANMERQICGAVKEAQQLQQRANDALKSASDAERDFRRLENECQSLLSQLRQQQQHEEQSDDPLCLSPMTPHPPGLMMSFQHTDTTGHFSTPQQQQQRSSKLPPLAPVPQLNVPPTFDFAALLTTSQGSPTRIKSSFRSESLNKSQSKSISFGPTTTYATSPTTDPDDDLIVPVATSTLRKSSHNNIILFNQNQQHSIIQLANSKMMT